MHSESANARRKRECTSDERMPSKAPSVRVRRRGGCPVPGTRPSEECRTRSEARAIRSAERLRLHRLQRARAGPVCATRKEAGDPRIRAARIGGCSSRSDTGPRHWHTAVVCDTLAAQVRRRRTARPAWTPDRRGGNLPDRIGQGSCRAGTSRRTDSICSTIARTSLNAVSGEISNRSTRSRASRSAAPGCGSGPSSSTRACTMPVSPC